MINFLRKLFCFHAFEDDQCFLTGDYIEVCTKCGKDRVKKK